MRKRPGSRNSQPNGTRYSASKMTFPGGFVPVLRNITINATEANATTARSIRALGNQFSELPTPLIKPNAPKAIAGRTNFATDNGIRSKAGAYGKYSR